MKTTLSHIEKLWNQFNNESIDALHEYTLSQIELIHCELDRDFLDFMQQCCFIRCSIEQYNATVSANNDDSNRERIEQQSEKFVPTVYVQMIIEEIQNVVRVAVDYYIDRMIDCVLDNEYELSTVFAKYIRALRVMNNKCSMLFIDCL